MKSINSIIIIKGLIIFSLVASFTSQTLVDIADFLVISTALFFAYKNIELKSFFKGFKPILLWPVWLVIVALGLFMNLGINNLQFWMNFTEFKWIITLLSLIYLMSKIEFPLKLIKAVSIATLILNLVSLFLYFYRHDGRAAGIFGAVMAFSHNIAPIFCLFAVLAFVSWSYFKLSEKILISSIILSSYLLTFLTFTRGVWLGAIAAIAFCFIVWNFKKSLLFLSAFFMVCVLQMYFFQSVSDRVLSKTINETSSNDARVALWKSNLYMVKEHPYFGVGHGQNKYYLPQYYKVLGIPEDTIISHAHNQYIQVWAGTGTLGLICYLFFLYVIFKTAWQGYKNASPEKKGLMLGLIAALLCFVVGALTEANFNISKNRFLFLLLAGMAIGFSKKVEKT